MIWTKLPLPQRIFAFTTSLAFVGFADGPISVQAANSLLSTQVPVNQPGLKLGLESQAFNRLQASVKFILPPLPYRRTPGRRSGAASRGECPSVSKPLTALVPATEDTLGKGISKGISHDLVPPSKSVLGLTTAEHPTFWFYIPYALTAERSVEFVLLDDQNNYVYKTTFVADGTSPGIVGLRLPSTAAPLKINQMYHWYFLVNCDEDSPIFVEGWVQRIALGPMLARQLEAATPRRRVDLYATNGIWHEALTTLAELHRDAPDDTRLAADWATLLQAVDLGNITSEPIVQCCTPKGL